MRNDPCDSVARPLVTDRHTRKISKVISEIRYHKVWLLCTSSQILSTHVFAASQTYFERTVVITGDL